MLHQLSEKVTELSAKINHQKGGSKKSRITSKKETDWIKHVKKIAKKHNITFKEALKVSKLTYTKKTKTSKKKIKKKSLQKKSK